MLFAFHQLDTRHTVRSACFRVLYPRSLLSQMLSNYSTHKKKLLDKWTEETLANVSKKNVKKIDNKDF